jgi:hypothetical protein
VKTRTLLGVVTGALLMAGAPSRAGDAPEGPRISSEPKVFDFGKALQNKTLRKDFVIRNFGTEDLEIEKVLTTCGCTAAITESKTVKPGGSTVLSVTLQTRTFNGPMEREILVQSNDETTNPLKLRVRATVVAQK